MKTILVANRGEIALRIIKSIKLLGHKAIAIYSTPDKNSLYLDYADETYELKGDSAQDTYLNSKKIIEIAKASKTDAIHPGYGFLSENSDFVEDLKKNKIIFIGPSAKVIKELGNKDLARILAKKLDIPITQGYNEEKQDYKSIKDAAQKIGYPLLIKAVGGGGGRGMRLVEKESELEKLVEAATREAQSFFNNPNIILEKHIYPARHIEVQLIGDNHGNIIHLYERDCSMQRRYQKVIEESPAQDISKELRENLLSSALKIAHAVKLNNAATAEFLVPKNLKDEFYFLEINPRIQVEHPVTEQVTGIDIVELQIKSALGERLALKQEDIKPKGHALEIRVCAEIPELNFQASIGEIKSLALPQIKEIRLEHSLKKNSSVSPYYDSLLLKAITHTQNREESIKKLQEFLEQLVIGNIETNKIFLSNLLQNFTNTNNYTSFIDENINKIKPSLNLDKYFLIALCVHQILKSINSKIPKNLKFFRQNIEQSYPIESYNIINIFQSKASNVQLISFDQRLNSYTFKIDDSIHKVNLLSSSDEYIKIELNKKVYLVYINNSQLDNYYNLSSNFFINGFNFEIKKIIYKPNTQNNRSNNKIESPLPGTILDIKVKTGEQVEQGQLLIILESMKMEHKIFSPCSGLVKEIRVNKSQNVKKGDTLILI